MTQTPATRSEAGGAGAVELSPGARDFQQRAVTVGRYGDVNVFMRMALNAESIEEATDIGDVIQASDHPHERIRFFDAAFLDSDPTLEADFPFYAVCDVVRELGEGVHEKMSIGAGHVIGVLLRACEKGWFPFDAELVVIPLGGGKKAVNLQLAPRRVENDAEI